MARFTMSLLLAVLLLPSLALAVDIAPTASYHDDQRGTPRLLLGGVLQPEPSFDPGETATNYLRSFAPLFRISPDLAGLEPAGEQESLLGKHYRYRQTIGGIPVLDAEIVVSVSLKDRRVYMVYNNTWPVAENAPARPRLALSGEDALDTAWNHLRVHGELLEAPTADLVYVPCGADFRLAYRARVATTAPFGYWEHLVDAVTGKILRFRAREVDGVNAGRVREDMFDNWFGPGDSRGERTAEFLRNRFRRERKPSPAATLASGTGKIFDPDPKSTLLSDTLTNFSPAADFVAAYSDCALQDISLDGGVYRLNGPWVSIQDFEPPYTPPSTTTDGNWTATRDNTAFHDVMTYFHIDQNQRYIQALGFPSIQHGPLPADSDGVDGADNSHYLPGTNQIAYGHGGVPDNEDADVILHEYWHAIQESINPNWGGADTGAMGEGFGDYWASSYGYTKANGPVFHPDWAFHWDGHNEYWDGRTHDKTEAQYDPAETYPDHTIVNGVNGDELWGTPIWQAFRTLYDTHSRPREEMDRIVLQSNYGLGSGVRMPDMAAAMLAAAQSLYPDGPHADAYLYRFRQNNIVPSPLQADTAALAAESCAPFNGRPDPGETVTYQLTVRNAGSSATTNLVGALRATNVVTSPSGPMVFGAIPAGGSTTCSFTFTVGTSLACGSSLPLTLDLQDGAILYPATAWNLPVGTENVLASQDFDSVTAPALPAGWSTAAVVGTELWTTSTFAAHSVPNAAFIEDVSKRTDSHLDTEPLPISSADDRLVFYQRYEFESSYDGGVLEISVDGAPFADIVAAGGSFAEGGYVGTISTSWGNPIGGRDAWVSGVDTFVRVVVVPPAAAVGKSVVFRFRIGCDTSTGAEGWYIDDLSISRWVCCEAPPVVPGDVDGDGVVSIADYGLLSLWMTQASGAEIREAAADLNHDGVIDVQDLVLLALML